MGFSKKKNFLPQCLESILQEIWQLRLATGLTELTIDHTEQPEHYLHSEQLSAWGIQSIPQHSSPVDATGWFQTTIVKVSRMVIAREQGQV